MIQFNSMEDQLRKIDGMTLNAALIGSRILCQNERTGKVYFTNKQFAVMLSHYHLTRDMINAALKLLERLGIIRRDTSPVPGSYIKKRIIAVLEAGRALIDGFVGVAKRAAEALAKRKEDMAERLRQSEEHARQQAEERLQNHTENKSPQPIDISKPAYKENPSGVCKALYNPKDSFTADSSTNHIANLLKILNRNDT